ncbi:unnamed protein product [Rotaria sp. Silwood1]|nr:unnamed protein product [Rotaria sp. Silwood1]
MSDKSPIWCAHPCHDEVLPNGKKRFWKTGRKPSHSKGKRSINQQLANFINNNHQAILNGSSNKLSNGDYLCTSCFSNEENCFMLGEEADMVVDDDYIRIDQGDAKTKLNQVFEFVNVKKIDDM